MTGRKTAVLIFGVFGVLVGMALFSAALSVLTADRDDDGFFISEEHEFEQASYAIASEDVDILSDAPSWVIDRLTNPVAIRVQGSSDAGASLFMGIAPTSDVDGYLSGVGYHEVTGIDFDDQVIKSVSYRTLEGTAAPTAPTAETFWVTSVEGTGVQTMDWSIESGNWTIVVMNADATPGVDTDLALGARISNIVAIAWIALAFGAISLLLGGYLMYRGMRPGYRPDRTTPTMDRREPTPAAPTAPREKEKTTT